MNAIEPRIAARLADGVYGIRDNDNIARGIAARGVSGLNDLFDIEQATIAKGVSGAGLFNKKSGFALIIPGKESRQGELAVVTRGTATG